MNLYAHFTIPDININSDGDESRFPEITGQIIQSLEHRTAVFDKLVELDYNDVLHDYDDYPDQSETPQTRIDIGFEVDDDMVPKLEADRDLIYSLVISELSDKHVIARDWMAGNVSYIGFE